MQLQRLKFTSEQWFRIKEGSNVVLLKLIIENDLDLFRSYK